MTVAADFDEHRRQLASVVSGAHDRERMRSFVEQFLRPHGISRPATPVLVEAIEALAGQPTIEAGGVTHAGS